MTHDRTHAGELTPRWQRAEAVLWRRTLGGFVVFPLRASAPLELSGPAAEVWQLLARPVTRDELHTEVTDAFGDGDAVTNQVDHALGQLRDIGGVCRV